ncbi:hypothetical protein HQ393_04095 [Chitinibacter bivalviorum]|uniref:SH3b domain-containing protein n=1 Tax=Chitinibacter bivalviorum TaxID=2739434 RepID=A0A7H9BGW1_9NEIS|nr:SH3 domain-containing protein [Chitinibacter bivalviorum]QLG87496.1 hypothetical protein HQ393_04095 [Chitinibacter bivalviorum]
MKALIYSLLLVSSFALAESGTVIRKTDLRDKPFLDASILASVPDASQVEIKSRKGAWMEVRLSDGKTGWIKLLNVRTSSGTTSSSNALSNVIKTGSSGKTVTTGVKGLSAEQIHNANPNPAEVEKMQSYATSTQAATQAALANGLSRKNTPTFTPSTNSGSSNTKSNATEGRRN